MTKNLIEYKINEFLDSYGGSWFDEYIFAFSNALTHIYNNMGITELRSHYLILWPEINAYFEISKKSRESEEEAA